jgi:hypothetical protein
VRAHIHNAGRQLDLERSAACKEVVRVSVADPAYAELLFALYEERLPWTDWSSRIAALDRALDQDLPVLPGGIELAAMAGLKAPPRLFADTKRYQQAVWRLLATARSTDDLKTGTVFDDSAGERFAVRLDEAVAKAAIHEARTAWVDHIRVVQEYLAGQGLSQGQLIDLIRIGLNARGEKSGDVETLGDKLDAMTSALGRFAFLANAGTTPYDPEASKRSGDVFDFSLLLALALPAIVVTLDERFKTHLQLSGTPHAARVILVDEFNARLADRTLAELVA